jgi:hypothetical protein
MLFGLLTALLFGGATAAEATPNNAGTFACANGALNIANCSDILDHVTVKITGNRVLTDNELNVLSDNLNNATLNITAIKNVVVDTYGSFNPKVDVSDINVCILSICG